MLITRKVTWLRVLPAPPVPAQAKNSRSTRAGGSEADDVVSTSDGGGGGGVVNELDDGPAHLNDLVLKWGIDLDACL